MNTTYDYRNIRSPMEADAFARGYNSGYYDAKRNQLREGDMRVALASDSGINKAWGQGYERGALDWITNRREKRWNFLLGLAGALIAIAFVAFLVYIS